MPYNYFPNYQNYFAPYPQAQQMQQVQQMQQQQTPFTQSGFVRVQSENEARMYPVAPGNSVTFLDETAPYCYVKTMDTSQLDRPKFEKYRLVKEDATAVPVREQNTDFATKQDLQKVREELSELKERIERRVKDDE